MVKGLSEALIAAKLADQLGNVQRLKKTLAMVWKRKSYVTAEQEAEFLELLERGEEK